MTRNENMLFEVEQRTIAEAEGMLNDEACKHSPLLPRYSSLIKQYKSLFKQFRHLIRLSDKQQEQLSKLNSELEIANGMIREIFGRYLSDEVVHDILATPGGVELWGEKRTVTIMMTDLRGFTSIGERLSAEDVVGMTNIYLEVMTETILKYNGTINDFIGDAILVVFGAPIRRDDDTLRAVACAVDMQLAVKEVNRRNREAGYPEVSMGIGINTGSVIVGNIGSRKRVKYSVMGRNVNLASRIESCTTGGQILVSRETAEACGPMIRIDDTLEVMPKGMQKPVTIYEVGGIGGAFNLYLPEKKRAELPELMRPLRVSFSVLEGKNVGDESYGGTVTRMSGLEADIRSETVPDKLSNLRVTLLGMGRNELGDLYAKVTENRLADPPGFRVHITSAPPHVHAFIEYASTSAGSPGLTQGAQ